MAMANVTRVYTPTILRIQPSVLPSDEKANGISARNTSGGMMWEHFFSTRWESSSFEAWECRSFTILRAANTMTVLTIIPIRSATPSTIAV